MKKLLLSFFLGISLFTHAQLIISEVATNNSGYYDDNHNEFVDWFEIYNAGATTINTSGYGLSDNIETGVKWLMPGVNLAPGQRKLVFASGNNEGCLGCGGGIVYLHTNFKLSTGETLALYDDSGNLLDSITLNILHAGDVMARFEDTGGWCYSNNPTPNSANTGECFSGYTVDPVILTAPGFYDASVDVSVSGAGEIYYTTDGSFPDQSDNLYTAPVTISTTTVFKATSFEDEKLPSNAATGSYFIGESTELPVVSLSGKPCDIFDIAPCYVGAYDNVSGWFQDNPQVPGTVEYFSADHVRQVSEDIKFEVAGNSSIAVYPMRSLQFTSDEDFNSNSEIQYNIFQHDKPGLDSLQGFRLRANLDWGNSDARMKDLIVNRLALPTHATAAAYQNVAAFINGDYWGHYSAREELDKYYLRNNFGCDIDSVTLIRSGAGEVVWDVAEAGTIADYNALKTFFNTHDMSDPADYALATEIVDVENWVDYWAVQVFVNNDETAYNIRCFKSTEPDIKWRMMLWDCGAGSEGETVNSLTTVLEYVYTSDEVTMMNDLLDNDDFRSYFINRYADLLNTTFQYSRVEALIDENADEIEAEIPAQVDRWNLPTSTTQWTNAVNQLKGFYDNRVYYQRNDIENHFDMNDQVNITLDVYPPGAGYIKISTIIPQDLPWTGVYFDGNPVTITAIPNPGYTFVDWEDNIFIDDPSIISFTKNITDNTTFTANFNGTPIANPIIISEVNFNSDSTINAGDWIELHNTSAYSISLTDYVFSNKIFYNQFKIPTNTVIPPGGYLVLAEDKTEFNLIYPDVTNVIGDFTFNLQNDGDSITLKDLLGNVLSTFAYNDKRPWPYTADGFGRTMELTADLADPVLPDSWFAGCVGGSPGEAYALCYENPLVDEINYNSSLAEDAGDWFELNNYASVDEDISGWKIQDKNKNTFIVPAGTILPAEGYLVFYQDARFEVQFPDVTNKVGPLNFGYDGQGDVILIYDGSGRLYQSVGFDDEAPYPLSPDGGGTALQIQNIALNINDPFNWIESCPEGSPGTVYTMPCANAVDDIVVENNIAVYPNPSDEFISFIMPENIYGESQLTISDMSGNILISKTINLPEETNVNIKLLPPGLYITQIFNEQFTGSTSFIKL